MNYQDLGTISLKEKTDRKIAKKATKWYAVYCKSNHEKKVYTKLLEANIECYLPLQTTVRQWSDRKKKVSLPLFSCYVFVKVGLKDYYTVLNITGVFAYVCFEGRPAPIPDRQINILKCLLESKIKVENFTENIPKGTNVRITCGPLKGITGELVKYLGKNRVVVRIEEINKTLLVNISPIYIGLR